MKILLIAIAFSATPAFAADPVVHRDLDYARSGNAQQTLDLYAPAGGKNHPVVVWIHGGEWAHGDKSDLQAGTRDVINRKPHGFVEKGCVFVAINYRLFPSVTVRQMAGDVAKAIRWVHEHAVEYGGDPDSIFVMGHSAGSQLSALVCTDSSYLGDEGLSLRLIKGCVPVDGDMYYPPLRIETEENVHEAASDRLKFPDEASQKEFSSVMHVAPGKGIPPFLLLHVADHPETGTLLQSQIFAQVLREAGVPVEVFPCAGKDHHTLNADLGLAGDPPTQAVYAFLDERLRASGLTSGQAGPAPAAAGATAVGAAAVEAPAAAAGRMPTPAFAADPPVHRDLAYSRSGDEHQKLDVYAPASGSHHPVVVWIHGGGWKYGDKADLQKGASEPSERKPRAFVDKGFVLVSINYRLLPSVTVAQMAGDVARAIRWVHDNIAGYGGDPDTIFVMGHSAGAQLSALVCTDRSYLDGEGLSLDIVKGCVPVDGDSYYPELQIDIDPRVAEVNAYLLQFPDAVTQKSLSSVLHVFKGKHLPPFLILHIADNPATHTLMQSRILAESLREAGIPATLVPCPGKDHDTLNAGIGLPGDGPTDAIFAFLAAQLGKTG